MSVSCQLRKILLYDPVLSRLAWLPVHIMLTCHWSQLCSTCFLLYSGSGSVEITQHNITTTTRHMEEI